MQQGSTDLEVQADYDGEERVLALDMILDLDICMWKEENVQIIEDLYSLNRELVPSHETIRLEHLLAKNYAKCKVNDRLSLDQDQNDILQICSCEGKIYVDETRVEEQGVQVEGSLEIALMFITTDDSMPIGTYRGMLGFEQLIEVPHAVQNMNYRLDTGIEQLDAVLSDNGRVEIEEIHEQETDLDALQKRPGMIGYLVKQGDSLWSIAKQNHTTVTQLVETNELEQEKIEKGSKLLIVKMV